MSNLEDINLEQTCVKSLEDLMVSMSEEYSREREITDRGCSR